MQRFVNDPNLIVDDMLSGFVKANPETELSDKNDPNVSFISGCSAATFSHLDTLISKSSYSAMVEILSLPQFQWQ